MLEPELKSLYFVLILALPTLKGKTDDKLTFDG